MVVHKKGFTLIELIFAIVVIAVTVLSLPMVSQVTSDSSVNNLNIEELVFESYVQAIQASEAPFATDVSTGAGTTTVLEGNTGELLGLKQNNSITITQAVNTSFHPTDSTAATNAKTKKISVTVTNATDNTLQAKFYVFDFDLSAVR